MTVQEIRNNIKLISRIEEELTPRINEILQLYEDVRMQVDRPKDASPWDSAPRKRLDHIEWKTSKDFGESNLLWVVSHDGHGCFIPLKWLNEAKDLKLYREEMINNILEERRKNIEEAREARYKHYLELKKEFEHGPKKGP